MPATRDKIDPRLSFLMYAAKSFSSPCATTSTLPSGKFLTVPEMRNPLAFRCAKSRYMTICTRPRTAARISFIIAIIVYYKAMESKPVYTVLLFYSYQTIEDPERVASWLRSLATSYKLLGRALVAQEGINATFEGRAKDTDAFVLAFKKDPQFENVQIKTSVGTGKSFPKLSVKVRQEIVGTRFPKEVDPRVKTAPHLSAEELKQWYENDKDFVVVDMRNSYEFASGHFKNSIDPGLNNSRDLPEAVEKLEDFKDKTVLTVCTGGVRCEKMSAYLMHKGFKDVYQLNGGIHTYMEKYPGEDFEGTLYTFDNRLTMDFGGNRSIVGKCRLCQGACERYVNCANNSCHLHFLACENCAPEAKEAYCGSC